MGTEQDETPEVKEGMEPAAEPVVEVIQEDTEKLALQERVQDLEARLRTVSAAVRNHQEEIHATRERLARQAQVEDEIRRGEVVATLFEPVENLLRSINASKGMPEESLLGLKMIHQEFMVGLKKLGLEEVPGVGASFDPSVHEAIATEPVAEAAKDNQVTRVFSTGYRIGKRLVRPARVVIGAHQE
jgi:molecular chaperone GrpE